MKWDKPQKIKGIGHRNPQETQHTATKGADKNTKIKD
jgi:hypothetical protein